MTAERHSALLQAIIESPQDIVIFALDRQYRYMAFNRNHATTMKHIWGVELKIGVCMLDVIGREDDRSRARANFDRALAGESFTLVEEYGDERINRLVYENVYSPIRDAADDVIGLTVYLTDVTAQRRAERELDAHRNRLEELVRERTKELEAAHAQLLYVQKLESVGVLAGGIAHDFNNLLAVILGRAELALGVGRGSGIADGVTKEHLEMIVETALEARSLTRQLLGYAGRGKFVVQPASLGSVVEDLSQVLRASVRKSIVIQYDLAEDPVPVEVDLTQISQVLLNLVSNAADAIGDERGTITVRTYETEVNAWRMQRACVTEPLPPGRYCVLEVEDTGCGMDERVRNRLFDPFFTTKRVGRGLGLAAVAGIVSSHRGCVLLESSPGRGSRFTLLFPPNSSTHAGDDPRVERTSPPPEKTAAQGAILVVDDEAPVREVATQMLASAGYVVTGVSGGSEALKAFRGPKDFDAVLLDLTMPHMDGQETLRGLRALREHVPVVLMTGYTERVAYLPEMEEAIDGFVAKPFSRQELLQAVAGALSRTTADAAGAWPRPPQ